MKTVAPTLELTASQGKEDPSDVGFMGGTGAMLEQVWPRCSSCKAPLQLFAQLCLDDCDGLFERSGFLTLFGCTRQECFDYDVKTKSARAVWEPHATTWRETPGERRPPFAFFRSAKAQHFVPWDEVIGGAIPELRSRYGGFDEEDEAAEDAYEVFAGGRRFGSQLGGYARGVQDGLWMVCKCGRRQALLAQLNLSVGFFGQYYLSTCLSPKCSRPFHVQVYFQTS